MGEATELLIVLIGLLCVVLRRLRFAREEGRAQGCNLGGQWGAIASPLET